MRDIRNSHQRLLERITLVPTTLDPAILGYIAGMVDGDGSITLRRGRLHHPPRLEVTVSNTCKELITWLTAVCGGSNRRTNKNRICGLDCDQNHIHKRKPGYRWNVIGFRAAVVLDAISPYLIEKRGKALELLLLKQSWPDRVEQQVLGDLRHRGWDL